MDGMLTGGMEKLMGGSGVTPGIDMRDPRVARAVRLWSLKNPGRAPNRVDIAEMLALETGTPQEQAPQPKGMLKGPAMGQRVADPNSAEGRAEADIERKRKAGPPADMLRRQRQVGR